ncbi:DNA-binding response OmpR family regulator [Pseudomonas monsensis]
MRVLLVEDHLQLAESVAQALKSTGLTVDVLHDGVAADLALGSEEYAVAILDVGLPRMDGFEVLARLRGTREKSAGADADGAQRCEGSRARVESRR